MLANEHTHTHIPNPASAPLHSQSRPGSRAQVKQTLTEYFISLEMLVWAQEGEMEVGMLNSVAFLF